MANMGRLTVAGSYGRPHLSAVGGWLAWTNPSPSQQPHASGSAAAGTGLGVTHASNLNVVYHDVWGSAVASCVLPVADALAAPALAVAVSEGAAPLPTVAAGLSLALAVRQVLVVPSTDDGSHTSELARAVVVLLAAETAFAWTLALRRRGGPVDLTAWAAAGVRGPLDRGAAAPAQAASLELVSIWRLPCDHAALAVPIAPVGSARVLGSAAVGLDDGPCFGVYGGHEAGRRLDVFAAPGRAGAIEVAGRLVMGPTGAFASGGGMSGGASSSSSSSTPVASRVRAGCAAVVHPGAWPTKYGGGAGVGTVVAAAATGTRLHVAVGAVGEQPVETTVRFVGDVRAVAFLPAPAPTPSAVAGGLAAAELLGYLAVATDPPLHVGATAGSGVGPTLLGSVWGGSLGGGADIGMTATGATTRTAVGSGTASDGGGAPLPMPVFVSPSLNMVVAEMRAYDSGGRRTRGAHAAAPTPEPGIPDGRDEAAVAAAEGRETSSHSEAGPMSVVAPADIDNEGACVVMHRAPRAPSRRQEASQRAAPELPPAGTGEAGQVTHVRASGVVTALSQGLVDMQLPLALLNATPGGALHSLMRIGAGGPRGGDSGAGLGLGTATEATQPVNGVPGHAPPTAAAAAAANPQLHLLRVELQPAPEHAIAGPPCILGVEHVLDAPAPLALAGGARFADLLAFCPRSSTLAVSATAHGTSSAELFRLSDGRLTRTAAVTWPRVSAVLGLWLGEPTPAAAESAAQVVTDVGGRTSAAAVHVGVYAVVGATVEPVAEAVGARAHAAESAEGSIAATGASEHRAPLHFHLRWRQYDLRATAAVVGAFDGTPGEAQAGGGGPASAGTVRRGPPALPPADGLSARTHVAGAAAATTTFAMAPAAGGSISGSSNRATGSATRTHAPAAATGPVPVDHGVPSAAAVRAEALAATALAQATAARALTAVAAALDAPRAPRPGEVAATGMSGGNGVGAALTAASLRRALAIAQQALDDLSVPAGAGAARRA
jgi:hypothetical protein